MAGLSSLISPVRLRHGIAAGAAMVVALAGCSSGSKDSATTLTTPGTTVKTSTAPVVKTSQAARAVEQQLVDVVQAVSPRVVQIETGSGLGSGVVFDDRGDVVTNAHVVGSDRGFTVTLSGGDRHKATLVGSYPQGDLAVVRLADARPRPASFADSSKTHVGEFALAVGNPLGLRSSVTQGIVSSVGRTVSEGNGATLPSAIQTSAPINPGNSGGALVDISGRVIGIPTLAALDPEFGGTPAPGIGFAIPGNTVRRVASQLVSSGRVPQSGRAYLGVVVATVVGGGVVVESVVPGGPADKAGIHPGDLIVSIDGNPTPTTEELASVLAALKPGQRVDVTIVRRTGGRATVSVTLGTPPKG